MYPTDMSGTLQKICGSVNSCYSEVWEGKIFDAETEALFIAKF